MSAPIHPRERERLDRVRALGPADTLPSAGLQALTACAARLTGVPVALITLIEDDTELVIASTGIELASAPREHVFCAHAVLGDQLFEVPDLQLDPRFRDNPFVIDAPRVRFYAGQPLLVDGLAVGTLCLLDMQPRSLTAADHETLARLGQAAIELLQSRQRLRQASADRQRLLDFARAAGDWMWESDAEHRYVWVSAAVEPLTGTAPEALIAQPIDDDELLDEQGLPLTSGLHMRALLGQQRAFARAVTRETSTRGLRYISRSAVPVFQADGSFAGYRGTARDISDALAAAEQARRSDATLRQLAAQVPGLLFTYEQPLKGPGAYRFMSDGAQQVLGASVPELLADPLAFFHRIHPEDHAVLGAAIDRCAAELAPLTHTFRITNPDGELRWLETLAAPTRLPDGGTLWHGFSADITERHATEEALRVHEERWKVAADAAGIGIAQFALADGRITMDARACANHGLPCPLVGFKLDDWMAQIEPVDRAAAQSTVEQALAGNAPVDGRYRVRRPDGQVRWLDFVVRATRDALGTATGLVGTCRDVHAQQMAAELQRDKAEAERASRAKTEFLSRVSHELRTPLNGILGFAQLMALDREQPLTATQANRLASVQRAGRRLLDLINDVLDLTRIERDEFVLAPVPVNLSATLRASLAMIQPLAGERGVVIALAADRALWAQGDARAVEQVLINLLSNALKYGPQGGRVAVKARRSGSWVCIAVSDQGPGLDAEQRSRLFQPFERLGAEQRQIEGSGLGLVIARQLAQAMGGDIEVESAPGQGSTFTLRLHAADTTDGDAPVSAPAPLGSEAPHSGAQPRRRVVYVEDETLNQVLLQEVFRTRPAWQLEIAGDGARGLELARSRTPDLMLIDMNLPDMNGLELLAALRAQPGGRQLRCIALSADAMSEQIQAARAAGFDDYWTKPIDVARVLGALDRLLGAASQDRSG